MLLLLPQLDRGCTVVQKSGASTTCEPKPTSSEVPFSLQHSSQASLSMYSAPSDRLKSSPSAHVLVCSLFVSRFAGGMYPACTTTWRTMTHHPSREFLQNIEASPTSFKIVQSKLCKLQSLLFTGFKSFLCQNLLLIFISNSSNAQAAQARSHGIGPQPWSQSITNAKLAGDTFRSRF
jgi:hypothetical protein